MPSFSDAKEIVICAALKADDGSIILGKRHSNCFITAKQKGLDVIRDPAMQGFVTSKNRFVSREEALKIQKAAGVKSNSPDGYRGNKLYSEDLY